QQIHPGGVFFRNEVGGCKYSQSGDCCDPPGVRIGRTGGHIQERQSKPDVRAPVLGRYSQAALQMEGFGPESKDPSPKIPDEGERLDPAKAQSIDQASTYNDFLQADAQARKGPMRSNGSATPAPVAQCLQPAGQAFLRPAKAASEILYPQKSLSTLCHQG